MNQNHTIQELKKRIHGLDIVQAVGKYVKLQRKGSEFLGLCPFHNEKTPSFSVNRVKGIYKCFGCGESGDSIQFVMKHKSLGFMEAMFEIAKEFNIPVEGFERNKAENDKKPPQNFKQVEPGIVLKTLNRYEINSFALFLASVFGWNKTLEALLMYYTGTGKGGITVFWQIDQFQRGRSVKLIRYQSNGKRDKSFEDYKPRDEKGFPMFTINQGYQPCFFGEHLLLQAERNSIIAIVESEKTAIIASLFFPVMDGRKVIWLASGGMNGFTDSKSWVLRGSNVLLVPDFSWISRAVWGLDPMRKKNGKFDPTGEIDQEYISVANKLQKLQCDVSFFNPCPEINDNSDLADILLKIKKPRSLKAPDFNNLILNV